MKYSFLPLACVLTLLSACDLSGGDAAVDILLDDESVSASSDSLSSASDDASMTEDGSMVESEPGYHDYSADVLANGETKVLFFHAAWCPICRAADADLTAWYASEDFAHSVYKVDYDSEDELRSRYGVVYQHTYVLVDGEGNAITTLSAPADTQLQALLRG